jgi:hypothetical protein
MVMATVIANEKKTVVLQSVSVTLSPEEAQKLYTLLYRGVGGSTLSDLGLYGLMTGLRKAIVVDKDDSVCFSNVAQL